MLRYHRDSASSRIVCVVDKIWCSFLETGGIVRQYRSDECNLRIHMTFAEILPRSIFFKFAFGRYKLNVMIYMILTTNQETFSLMILAKRNRQQSSSSNKRSRLGRVVESIWPDFLLFYLSHIYIIYSLWSAYGMNPHHLVQPLIWIAMLMDGMVVIPCHHVWWNASWKCHKVWPLLYPPLLFVSFVTSPSVRNTYT